MALWLAARDPRVPWYAKAVAGAVEGEGGFGSKADIAMTATGIEICWLTSPFYLFQSGPRIFATASRQPQSNASSYRSNFASAR